MPQWIWFIIFIAAMEFTMMIIMLWQRAKYSKKVEGCIMGEFWPETGVRYKLLLPVEVNGVEVKAPRGHQCPRYFFNKQSTYTTKYPDIPFLPFLKAIQQVDVPIVAWPENNPEPINPYREVSVATSALIDSLRDDDFAAFAMAASKEIAELERQLAEALANTISKKWFYILMIAVLIASLAIAVIVFLIKGDVSDLKQMWGA